MNMEKDGYDFSSLIDEVKKDFKVFLKEPYCMNTMQAIGFLEDQFDYLRSNYLGFSETLYVILADILVENGEYSERIFSRVFLILEKKMLYKIWEENLVSNEEIKKRTKYLKKLIEKMNKIKEEKDS